MASFCFKAGVVGRKSEPTLSLNLQKTFALALRCFATVDSLNSPQTPSIAACFPSSFFSALIKSPRTLLTFFSSFSSLCNRARSMGLPVACLLLGTLIRGHPRGSLSLPSIRFLISLRLSCPFFLFFSQFFQVNSRRIPTCVTRWWPSRIRRCPRRRQRLARTAESGGGPRYRVLRQEKNIAALGAVPAVGR